MVYSSFLWGCGMEYEKLKSLKGFAERGSEGAVSIFG
jgi:hypothetical protein